MQWWYLKQKVRSYCCAICGLLSAALLFSLSTAFAAPKKTTACHDAASEPVTIRAVSIHLDVTLTDGRVLRMRGIRAPRGTKDWPGLAAMARFALDGWVTGKKIYAAIAAGPADRWGRQSAQLWQPADPTGKDTDASGRTAIGPGLIAAGWAFADPLTLHQACRASYLKMEAQARKQKLGLWSDPWYGPLDPHDIKTLELRAGQTVIAEGVVKQVRRWKSLQFINFGDRKNKALGLMLTRRAQRAFKAGDVKPDSLKGRRLRVRGLLEPASRPGLSPRIRLNGPQNIELLP